MDYKSWLFRLYDDISYNSIQNIYSLMNTILITLALMGSLVEEIDMKSFEKLRSFEFNELSNECY